MRKSSALQEEFDFSDDEASASREPTSSADEVPETDRSGSDVPLKIPTFGFSQELFAIASRRAGRLNAANVSADEYDSLLKERQALLDKKFSQETFSRKDAIRLDYVHWSLDRIEDARYGDALDVLEGSVGKYEQFLTDVQNLTQQLSGQKRGRKR